MSHQLVYTVGGGRWVVGGLMGTLHTQLANKFSTKITEKKERRVWRILANYESDTLNPGVNISYYCIYVSLA